MPFLPVKCTNCGGSIELDDQREKGFCMYCGSQIVYKEAVQKMELSGVVSVKGVADKEKLLQNAEIFVKLKEYKKASAILLRVTDDYPEDYRGWWQLAKFAIFCPFKGEIGFIDPSSDFSWSQQLIVKLDFHSKYNFNWYSYGGIDGLVPWNRLYIPVTLMRNAVNLAPTETAPEMKRQVKEWLQTYMAFYSLALKYLQEDVEKAPKDPSYLLWKIDQEVIKRLWEIDQEVIKREKEYAKKLWTKHGKISFESEHDALNHVHNNRLIQVDISKTGLYHPERRPESYNYAYHFEWHVEDWVSCIAEVCLRKHGDTEISLKQGVTELQEQIKEFDF